VESRVNKPSSTITAAGVAGFAASTLLLIVKIVWPDIYVQIPDDYKGYLITTFVVIIGYYKKENVLPLVKDEEVAG
jgi:hypothetical protein